MCKGPGAEEIMDAQLEQLSLGGLIFPDLVSCKQFVTEFTLLFADHYVLTSSREKSV